MLAFRSVIRTVWRFPLPAMHRRHFLTRCGLAAAGAALLPTLVPSGVGLHAADAVVAASSSQLTGSDRALLRLLSAYSGDVYFWGSQVFTRATGAARQGEATHLLARVGDYGRLVAFLRSDAEKKLGRVYVDGNTLSFTYKGANYAVTNADSENFARAAAGSGVSRWHVGDGDVALFTHEALLYHPATDSLNDPHLALKKNHIDLAETPTGGLKSRFQTLVHGWLESKRTGLKLGKRFDAFQDDLLAAEPTDKAAAKVVQALLANISMLAASFDVDALRPLLTSPLVSTSLEKELGLDAEDVLAKLEALRADLANHDYSDAALWLATLLGPHLTDGSLGDWLDLLTGDSATDAATRTALQGARKLATAVGAR